MKKVIIIGSGLSGLTCSIELAKLNIQTLLVSPYPSERSQSVMAAGGINASISKDDDVSLHIEDTFNGGCQIDDLESIRGLCHEAKDIIEYLESIGTVFSKDKDDNISLRAFGGQSRNRTAYAGSSTGKQIMTALISEARKYENKGLIIRKYGRYFHSSLIKDNECYGVILYNDTTREMEIEYGDSLVIASGGQNALFGKTTGSVLCDGYVVGKLFTQGATLRNLEFIQYHPTTIETSQKRMLISEASRGEGGRLYYLKDNKRVYFMEDLYGEKGNLMSRDIVSKHIYDAPSQVYLDISFLGKDIINERLLEVSELTKKYLNIDVSKESIPVYPSVHFFMGGLKVDRNHLTSIKRIYAIGECASLYHGGNRLGGNSLLAAIRSARVASKAINLEKEVTKEVDFKEEFELQKDNLKINLTSKSQFSAMYIRQEIAKIMDESLGITRNEEKLKKGIEDIEYFIDVSKQLSFNSDVSFYISYSLESLLVLGKAILVSALERKETRGAHIRSDYPLKDNKYNYSSYISLDNGAYKVSYTKE